METPASVVKEASSKPSAPTAVVTSYRIQPGDNLGKIARRYGVTVEQLKEWNGLSSDLIQAGKTLRVRPPDRVAQGSPPPAPLLSSPSRSQLGDGQPEGSPSAPEMEGTKPPETGSDSHAPSTSGPAIETAAPPVEIPPSSSDPADAHDS